MVANKSKITLLIALLFLLTGSLNAQNSVLEFDGVDDYLNLGSDAGDSIRTIEMWFKFNEDIDSTLQSPQCLFIRDTETSGIGNNADEFGVFFNHVGWDNPGCLRYKSNSSDGLSVYEVFSNQNTWNKDQWYHFAVVLDETNGIAMFIDGIKQNDTEPLYTSATGVRSEETTVGAQDKQAIRYFNGSVDEIHFSHNALYSSNFTPPCNQSPSSASTGLWKFEETSGNIAIDSSSAGNDADISGAVHALETVCTTSSVSNLNKLNNLILYPNPSNGTITFELENFQRTPQNSVIIIRNTLGSVVHAEIIESKKTSVNLAESRSGVYNYTIYLGNGTVVSGHFLVN